MASMSRVGVGGLVHHMAPVAPDRAHREQHGLARAPRSSKASSLHERQVISAARLGLGEKRNSVRRSPVMGVAYPTAGAGNRHALGSGQAGRQEWHPSPLAVRVNLGVLLEVALVVRLGRRRTRPQGRSRSRWDVGRRLPRRASRVPERRLSPVPDDGRRSPSGTGCRSRALAVAGGGVVELTRMQSSSCS